MRDDRREALFHAVVEAAMSVVIIFTFVIIGLCCAELMAAL